MSGRPIVLAATDSESTEYLRSNWRQMLLASLPARFTRFPFYMTDISVENEIGPDGQARYVPHGLRIVEAILLKEFAASEVAVCHPNQLDQFVGDRTRVVGLHAPNPVGLTFGAGIY